MARSRITQQGIQLTNDSGSVLQSLVAGEQVRTEVQLKFFTNINGAKIAARIIEADNSNLTYANGVPDEYPTEVRTGAEIQYMPIGYYLDSERKANEVLTVFTTRDSEGLHTVSIDSDLITNEFQIIWNDDIVDNFVSKPKPDQPVYGFVSVEIRDRGEGELQQIYKPIRGLVEIRYAVRL